MKTINNKRSYRGSDEKYNNILWEGLTLEKAREYKRFNEGMAGVISQNIVRVVYNNINDDNYALFVSVKK